jgi:hypothetical protein
MKNNKVKSSVKLSCSIETRPDFFNFLANKGRNILLLLKNENIKTGILLGLPEPKIVRVVLRSPQGYSFISETNFVDISEIIILDE